MANPENRDQHTAPGVAEAPLLAQLLSQFNRVFRRVVGQAPKHYRAQFRHRTTETMS
jgi:hypothetical protein